MARPIVLGEDPGLSASLADPWGMVLTLLWLVAAAGWAAWRFWLRPASLGSEVGGQGSEKTIGSFSSLTPDPWPLTPGHWYGGSVQTALLATVALIFVSSEWAASYHFPARLIAWEWFGLFVSFMVVRQLAITPAEQHGLFAVVLAGAVALAAQGIYQELVELPQNRRLAETPEEFRARWAEENPGQSLDDPFLEQLRQRAMENNIFGPYAHPNSYAGFLVLWLPGLIGGVVVSRNMQEVPGRILGTRTVLMLLCVVLGFVALWLTHSRGAILGLATAGVGVGLCVYWRLLRARILAVLIGSLVLIALVYGLLATGIVKKNNAVSQRLEYWQTTWQMIQERPWLGVGPGNFGENYTRLMPAASEEKVKDPHNFALEVWSTSGIFALLMLLAALAAFFYRVVRRSGDFSFSRDAQRSASETLPSESPLSEEAPPLRWEYYLGGMFGLLLGFVLRVNTATAGSIMAETYAAAVRSVVWFAAYALLERLDWTQRGRALALTTGIAALLLNLCVSGGIGFPSVAGPLWIAVALALNVVALRPVAWLSRSAVAMILPLPLFLGLVLGYGFYILYPVLESDRLVREAAQAVAFFQNEKAKPLQEQSSGVRDHPIPFLRQRVIKRLEQARELTPGDARIYVQLAWGTHQLWEANEQRTRRELATAERALRYGMTATDLDPHGAAGYWVQYQIRMRYALINEKRAEELSDARGDPVLINNREHTAREQYQLAAKTLEVYLPDDPHDASLHYAMWRAYHKGGEKEKAREHAAKALELDKLVSMPARKLTDKQRNELEKGI